MKNKIIVAAIDWEFIYYQLSARKEYFHEDLVKNALDLTRCQECITAINKIQLAMSYALENM